MDAPHEYDQWMREKCMEGTRLELAARISAGEALAYVPSEDERQKVQTALDDANAAKEHFRNAAERLEAQAVRLATMANSSSELLTKNASLKQIAEAICERHKISLDKLRSESKSQSIVWARQEFFYFADQLTSRSKSEIGRWAKRDHSTVIHGIRKHASRMRQGA